MNIKPSNSKRNSFNKQALLFIGSSADFSCFVCIVWFHSKFWSFGPILNFKNKDKKNPVFEPGSEKDERKSKRPEESFQFAFFYWAQIGTKSKAVSA